MAPDAAVHVDDDVPDDDGRRRYRVPAAIDGTPQPVGQVDASLLAEARDDLRATGRSSLGVDWHAALDSGMLELVREGRLAEAKERLQACLSSSSD